MNAPSDQLRDVLVDAGWALRVPSDGSAAFIASSKAGRYAIEIRSAKEARRSILEGLLAAAILRARAAARAANARPLAIIAAPSLSAAVLAELGEFVAQFGEGVAWGAIDDRGLVVLHGPGIDGIRRERRRAQEPSIAPRADSLSDLGQWMLKVLLSHRLPPELRMLAQDHSRIDAPIVNAAALARIAEVSVPSASRFVSALRDEQFLVDDDRGLALVRIEELLDRWRAVYKRRPAEARARWLFAPKAPAQHLDAALHHVDRACLGLFAACDRLGFHFVHGVAPHIQLEHVSADALRQLGLRLAEPGEAADVIVREPRFPESVFRGASDRTGARVSDVLQCWLDVADNPARGEEMADHLFEHVIRPHLLDSP